jgi:hypothetical protein
VKAGAQRRCSAQNGINSASPIPRIVPPAGRRCCAAWPGASRPLTASASTACRRWQRPCHLSCKRDGHQKNGPGGGSPKASLGVSRRIMRLAWEPDAEGGRVLPVAVTCGRYLPGMPGVCGHMLGSAGTIPCLIPQSYQLSTTVPVSRMPMPPVMGQRMANQ